MTPTPSNPDAIAALQPALAYAEDWIAYRAFQLRVPGVQYAVLFDGEVQLSGAVGLADVEAGVPLTRSHLFRVASHSKTFTATAVLQLVEAGKLTLDTPLGDVVGELAGEPVGSVAVRELLEHGGGVIRDSVDGDFWQLTRPFPDEGELLALARTDGTKVEPNTRFAYSNIGYSLLGLVVARVTGESYNDYVRREIVGRLGLADTDPELAARAQRRLRDRLHGLRHLARTPADRPHRHPRDVGGDRLHEHRGRPRAVHRGAPPRRRAPAHRRLEAPAAARRLAERSRQARLAAVRAGHGARHHRRPPRDRPQRRASPATSPTRCSPSTTASPSRC